MLTGLVLLDSCATINRILGSCDSVVYVCVRVCARVCVYVREGLPCLCDASQKSFVKCKTFLLVSLLQLLATATVCCAGVLSVALVCMSNPRFISVFPNPLASSTSAEQ